MGGRGGGGGLIMFLVDCKQKVKFVVDCKQEV